MSGFVVTLPYRGDRTVIYAKKEMENQYEAESQFPVVMEKRGVRQKN
jgi:hypothetical protein